MASANPREELKCSICLNIYTDPVTMNCGHNFCKLCIGNVLDNQTEAGIYSCPECRAQYQERPTLHKNTTLCNIAEWFRNTHPAESVTEITCTYCVQTPVPAAKTCLLCEASLCETHLMVHSQSAEHVLISPTIALESCKCSIHKEVLKYYCIEDATCICVSCSLAGEHKGHEVETLNEAYGKTIQRMRKFLDKLKRKREEAEKQVHSLTKHKREVKKKADRAKERVTALMMDIRKQLEAVENKVLTEITLQEQEVSRRVSDLIQQLEKKKSEMTKEMDRIEELLKTADPLAILQGQRPFNPEFGDALKHGKNQDLLISLISGSLQTSLAKLIHGLKRKYNIMEITKPSLDVNMSPDILLDVNTASNDVIVSSDLKTVSRAQMQQNRPETKERFQFYPQVLSTSVFTSGRHYLEVETSGDGWIIGMAYPSIERKGRQYYSNINAASTPYCTWRNHAGNQTLPADGIQSYLSDHKSWRLRLHNNMYSVMRDGKISQVNYKQSSLRICVYLDYEAGLLSFYELADPLRHIETIKAKFTKPLHVAICVWGIASVKMT